MQYNNTKLTTKNQQISGHRHALYRKFYQTCTEFLYRIPHLITFLLLWKTTEYCVAVSEAYSTNHHKDDNKFVNAAYNLI